MNDPPRLLDPKSGAPLSRSLLRAGVDMGPPPGAKEQIWSSLSGALGVAAVVSAAPTATTIGTSAATQASASTVGANVGMKAAGMKLIAGKWVLLSSLALVVAGGAAYRIFGSSRGSDPAAQIARDTHGSPADLSVAGTAKDVTSHDPTRADATNPSAPLPSPENALATPDDKAAIPVAKSPAKTTSNADASSASSVRDASGHDHRGPDVSSGTSRPLADPLASKDAVGAASTDTPDSSNRLLEESAALADARRKLNAGDSSGTLQSLQEMDKHFGGGGLSQERAALLVQALAANGQRDAAARFADSFLASYPSSPFVPRVRPFATQ